MSDMAVSQFWSYVKPGEWRTCDECGVSQKTADVERVKLNGEQHDRCRDKQRCARWRRELAKTRPKKAVRR